MSRLKRFGFSLATGYLLMGVNTLTTLISVPVALHYLTKEGFGLWAVVTQVSAYLALVDFGMGGSISRILVDHKDHPTAGDYASFIKTGLLVLAVQGLIIIFGGWLLSLALPGLCAEPAALGRDLQRLFAGMCLLLGLLYPARIASLVLQAHQRFDVINLASTSGAVVSLAVLWVGFARGLGVYSFLLAYAVSSVIACSIFWAAMPRLKLLPPSWSAGHVSWSAFKEMFAFGSDIFLYTVGYQLLNASQVFIVNRMLGPAAAAVWAVATKAFTLAQQLVGYFWTYSSSALSEMYVRGERELHHRRFSGIVRMVALMSAWAGAAIALCNAPFLSIWTHGIISWDPLNDWLLAPLLLVTTVVRCHQSLVGQTKQVRGMRYICFVEGIFFVGISFWLAPRFGMTAILATAIVLDVLCSGVYGVWRSAREFGEPMLKVAFGWTGSAWIFWALLMSLCEGCWWLTRGLSAWPRFISGAAFVGIVGALLFWKVGLTPELREEARQTFSKLAVRARLGKPHSAPARATLD
jgi:O-antigen/teichoic acid export membrane protein